MKKILEKLINEREKKREDEDDKGEEKMEN